MRKIVYPLIWLAVTAAAVLIASAAVSSVRDQVTDTPTAMLPPTTIAISSTDQLVADPAQSETPPTTVPKASTAPPTSVSATTPKIPTDAPTTVPTATIAPSSEAEPEPVETSPTVTATAPTTTTSAAPTTEIRSYDLVGGSVSIVVGDGTVRLAGASPKPGFTMEVEGSGAEKVEVEFHNDDHESHFKCSFEDGRFVPSIEESSEADDD